jgi:hypothetical protein
MIDVKVIFEDSNSLVTGINATIEEARRYYVGRQFQFGDTEECPNDKLIRAISCELIL